MAKITAELLRAMVGRTKGQQINALVEPLNLVLPAYGITTELRVSAFLATAAPESDWFKTLREYGKGRGRAYGKAINGLIYYGRGIFQVTWLKNYKLFTEYVRKNWASIKDRAAKYGYTEAPDFVNDPELLATPYWAVEAACWYWKANGLAKYADRGLTGFFGLQGLVNRGDASKRALSYDERLSSYETARRLIPDDFKIENNSAVAKPTSDEPEPLTEGSTSSGQITPSGPQGEAPPTDQATNVTAQNPAGTLQVATVNEQDVTKPAQISEPSPYQGIGFWGVIKRDLSFATGGNLSFAGLNEYATQASGWPPWVIAILGKVAVGLLIATVAYFVFRVIHYLVDMYKQNKRVTHEIDAKTAVDRRDIEWVKADGSTPTQRVIAAEVTGPTPIDFRG